MSLSDPPDARFTRREAIAYFVMGLVGFVWGGMDYARAIGWFGWVLAASLATSGVALVIGTSLLHRARALDACERTAREVRP